MRKVFFVFYFFSCFFLYPNTMKIKNELVKQFPDYFFEQDCFFYIGKMTVNNDVYQFYQCQHIFGNSRMSWRLVVEKNNIIKGFYSGIQMVPKIEDSFLVFDVDENIGSRIDFTSKIPDEVYIDGEKFKFKYIEENQKEY